MKISGSVVERRSPRLACGYGSRHLMNNPHPEPEARGM